MICKNIVLLLIPRILTAFVKLICAKKIRLVQLNRIKQSMILDHLVKIKMNRVTYKIFFWKL